MPKGYLLDTNACIALLNGRPESVRHRYTRATQIGAEVFLPAIAAFELWYGVAKSARPETNRRRLAELLGGPLRLLPFEEEDAERAGELRAALEKKGKPIGAYDLLIAGQALRHGLTLITSNQKEFERVPGLHWENWGDEDSDE